MSAAQDAAWAAALFAVDPAGLGGVCLHSLVQPARIQWLEMLRDLLPPAVPVRRIPFNISDGGLLGGLDLTATLASNRPIAARGALAATDGGVVMLCMAERLSAHTAACLNAVLDSGAVFTQREGVLICDRARLGVVAQDESMDEERVPASLLDRLAFLVDLNGFDLRTPLPPLHDREQVQSARRLLPEVQIGDDLIEALCGTGLALGAGSVRVSLLAVRAARAMAALDARSRVDTEDAVAAARLVFAPRATRVPQPAPGEEQNDEKSAQADTSPDATRENVPAPPSSAAKQRDETEAGGRELTQPDDAILAATQAAIPRGLLTRLRSEAGARGGSALPGRAGALRSGARRGRPAGTQVGASRGHVQLNVMETLRAAAPWQRLRGRTSAANGRVVILPGDFRITRYQQRSQTLTIFAVDASGSSALNRLAEAKGAVEMLLAECYVRRDLVAVITFRGRRAELLLPPTRSLVRAKRNLAGLPGGGGTPLASAIDCAALLGGQALRRGETPLLVMLTDGRANVSLGGSGGREAAHADALQAARRLQRLRIAALFIDTSPLPRPPAAEVAAAMGANYLPLPFADARVLSGVVSAATARSGR
ncbi:MAG: magnesium chelatase subunit D [Steroidobacteraceae bacterium]